MCVGRAEKKGIRLDANCDSRITVRHDPKWTAGAIENILDNAVKYTRKEKHQCAGAPLADLYKLILQMQEWAVTGALRYLSAVYRAPGNRKRKAWEAALPGSGDRPAGDGLYHGKIRERKGSAFLCSCSADNLGGRQMKRNKREMVIDKWK